jgi:hypothetical protein
MTREAEHSPTEPEAPERDTATAAGPARPEAPPTPAIPEPPRRDPQERKASSWLGPPSRVHGLLARAFEGALVRRQAEGPMDVYTVQANGFEDFQLGVDRDLAGEPDLLARLVSSTGVVDQMKRHPGRRVRLFRSEGRVFVETEGGSA